MKRVAQAKTLPPWLDVFLAAVAGGMWDQDAARRAGVGHTSVCEWKKKSELFRAAYKEAKQERKDNARQEIYRRAFIGVKRRKYVLDRDGNKVLLNVEREYSDKLAVAYAQANLPEYKRQQNLNIGGQDGGLPVPIIEISVKDYADAQRFRELEAASAPAIENKNGNGRH